MRRARHHLTTGCAASLIALGLGGCGGDLGPGASSSDPDAGGQAGTSAGGGAGTSTAGSSGAGGGSDAGATGGFGGGTAGAAGVDAGGGTAGVDAGGGAAGAAGMAGAGGVAGAPTCPENFADCDGSPRTGCESLLTLSNCGVCGKVCNLANGFGDCSSGSCVLTGCKLNSPFVNCDGDPYNGCEVDTHRDPANCGGCGSACASGQNCVSGACVPSTGIEEICDGIDNDADGLVDNLDPDLRVIDAAIGKSCFGGNRGVCADSSHAGVQKCIDGGIRCCDISSGTDSEIQNGVCVGSVPPYVVHPGDLLEVCNGLDDDCDGYDDSFGFGPTIDSGAQCAQPVGTCATGLVQCWSGQLVCDDTPPREGCNGVDDDCDGLVDEGPIAECDELLNNPDVTSATCLQGLCAIDGCVTGRANLDLDASNGCEATCSSTGTEICNGLDDDCNGAVDDSLTDAPLDPGCWNVSGASCTFGSLSWDPPPDGTCSGRGTLVGECRAGSLECHGALGWTCFGDVPPSTDWCDGLDNDCEGTADFPAATPVGFACGVPAPPPQGGDVGECREGTLECRDGVLVCTAVEPKPEICNGLDDDCDSRVDDPIYCGTNLGRCEPGKLQCQNGVAGECIGAIGPSQEVCDGYDNDCDGLVDEAGACP